MNTRRPDGWRAVVDRVDAAALALRMESETAADVPFYSQIDDPVRAAQVRGHCRQHADAVIATLVRGAAPSAQDIAFVHEHATLRARQHVPISAFLHAYRAGYRATWASITEGAEVLGSPRDVLAHLSELALAYFDTISGAATAAYAEQRERAAHGAVAAQVDLLEHLLLGAPSSDTEASMRMAAFGLAANRGAQAFVVEMRGEVEPEIAHALARTISQGLSEPGHAALVVLRRRQLVGVLGLDAGATDASRAIASALRVAAAQSPVPMFAGIGLPAAALAGVARSHEEAQRALLHTDPERPVRALADVPLFDDLLAGADAMVRSRLPRWVATLRTEDASGELLATLRALLDAGNSAAKAAKVLGVHVNTVRYRMQRLATITGSDLGDFRQLADVVVALRLADPRWL